MEYFQTSVQIVEKRDVENKLGQDRRNLFQSIKALGIIFFSGMDFESEMEFF